MTPEDLAMLERAVILALAKPPDPFIAELSRLLAACEGLPSPAAKDFVARHAITKGRQRAATTLAGRHFGAMGHLLFSS